MRAAIDPARGVVGMIRKAIDESKFSFWSYFSPKTSQLTCRLLCVRGAPGRIGVRDRTTARAAVRETHLQEHVSSLDEIIIAFFNVIVDRSAQCQSSLENKKRTICEARVIIEDRIVRGTI